MKPRIFCCTCLLTAALTLPANAAPREWSDDFTTVTTYNTLSLLAPCYGGPPTKYTLMDFTGDIFNNFAVSGPEAGQGRFRNNARNLQNSALGGRIDFAMVGWMGIGVGCPSEPPFGTSSEAFTSPRICIYQGWQWNSFQIRRGDGPGGIFGDDFAPGVAGVDEDLDGTVDGTVGTAGVDDDGDGVTDELNEVPDMDEYPGGGPDGGPGVAGVDDDGINGLDDIGEYGFPGSDDSDDERGDQGHFLLMRLDLLTTSAIWNNFSPTGTGNQFSIRDMVFADENAVEHNDEMASPNYYQANTIYNSVFCTSGTCWGAQLWKETDMVNPVETLGPVINTTHTNPAPSANSVGLGTDNSFGDSNGGGFPESITTPYENQTFLGNSNFSHTWWACSGDPAGADFVNGVFGYPSPSSDLDGDRDVDVNDFLTFSGCFAGSLVPPAGGCQNDDADLDDDGDVDVNDFLTFSSCFAGSLTRPNAACFPSLTANFSCTAPANDTCAGAIPVGETTLVASFNGTVGQSVDHCALSDDERDLWYKYTPTCTGTATVDVNCDVTGLTQIENMGLAVYTDCPPAGSQLVCQNLNNCGTLGETASFAVSSGTPVYIAVLNLDVDPADFRLTITCGP